MDRTIAMDMKSIQMERINCVRMFLGVTYLSKISNISGNSFQVGITTGTYDIDEYNTTLNKAKQKKPNS
jgi:hypothetical protein